MLTVDPSFQAQAASLPGHLAALLELAYRSLLMAQQYQDHRELVDRRLGKDPGRWGDAKLGALEVRAWQTMEAAVADLETQEEAWRAAVAGPLAQMGAAAAPFRTVLSTLWPLIAEKAHHRGWFPFQDTIADPRRLLDSCLEAALSVADSQVKQETTLPPAPIPAPVSEQASAVEQTSAVTRAIVLITEAAREGRICRVKDLEAAVGCDRSTLYRDPAFRAARKAAKEERQRRLSIPRGHRTEGGGLEAEDLG